MWRRFVQWYRDTLALPPLPAPLSPPTHVNPQPGVPPVGGSNIAPPRVARPPDPARYADAPSFMSGTALSTFQRIRMRTDDLRGHTPLPTLDLTSSGMRWVKRPSHGGQTNEDATGV